MVFGYIDAGTGTLILQVLIGGLAGAAVFIKYRWGQIRSWFKRAPESEQ